MNKINLKGESIDNLTCLFFLFFLSADVLYHDRVCSLVESQRKRLIFVDIQVAVIDCGIWHVIGINIDANPLLARYRNSDMNF